VCNVRTAVGAPRSGQKRYVADPALLVALPSGLVGIRLGPRLVASQSDEPPFVMRLPRIPRRASPIEEPRRRSRLTHWVRRSLACLAGLGALVVVSLLVVAGAINRPWLKRRVQSLARTSTGVDIDYRAARIEWLSGVEIEGLVVQSPTEVRPFAPELVRVGGVHARWSPWALILGRGPVISRLEVSDLTLTAVVDEHGRTSFDALGPSNETSASGGPTVPLSRQASRFLGVAPPLGQLDVDRVTLILIRTEQSQVSDRTELQGLSATMATSSAEPGAKGWRADIRLGSPASPLELGLTRTRGGRPADTARARLWATVDATSSAVRTTVDLRMIEQTFAASVSAEHWLHAEASLRFDPTVGRTELLVEHTEAGDGAATAEASVEITDAGDPFVRHARADIDLARLSGWLPVGLVPVQAERAQVRCRADSLALGPVVRLSEGGEIAVDGDLSNARISMPSGLLQVGRGELSLRVEPAVGGGVAGRGSVHLVDARGAAGDGLVAADDLGLDFDGQQAAGGEVTGRVGVRFARAERGGASSVVARDGRLELHVRGLVPHVEEPLATRGDLALSLDVATLDARFPGTHVIIDGLTLRAHTALEGQAPYAVEVEAPATRLRIIGRDGDVLADAPARVDVSARDLQPDIAHPAASRGIIHAAVDLREIRASLDATKAADAVDFAMRASAASLKAARPFLPPNLTGVAPWDQMSASVQSTGHVERLQEKSPEIRQTTEIDLARPAFQNAAARSVSLVVKSQGTALRHQADLDVHAQGLAFDGGGSSDDHVTLAATLDRENPSLRFQLITEGRASTKLSGLLSLDPSRRVLHYEVEGRLAGLAPLAPFAAKIRGLDAFDLSQLEVELSSRGALLGVVAGVEHDGTIRLEPNVARTAAVEGSTDLRVAHLRWAKGTTAIVTPALAWHGDMSARGGRRSLNGRLEVGTLHLDLGSRNVDVNGIRDDAGVAVLGSLVDPEIELTERLSAQAVEQDIVPEYPIGDMAFALSAERGPEGEVHISDMKVENRLGGTVLALTGNADLGEGRRTLSITTSLTQDLARLSLVPERFNGQGTVAVEANVTSPDLTHYRVRGAVKGENVTVRLPRAGIKVETASGDVPVAVALDVHENGIELQRTEERSPFSMLRFADQHPLLSRSGFLSIGRLTTPWLSIAPLVGNLEIDRNVMSLRQFEMGVRGGTITGQCGIDWDGAKSTLDLHVRASGVQSSHGEPFDGNIAVAISAADRTVEGRAEILRIGEHHLLDLLDLEDPRHVDPAMNRIRFALNFGYPDSLRVVFDHGFASAHLELGGLARLVSIADLRGIPMGPIVDQMLAPVLDAKGTP
jgi:translocation and assembly module TamB